MSKNCKIGFPCSKTCISRNKLCWANLSTETERVAETFEQFVNRVVGIGNEIESAILNSNPLNPTLEDIENSIRSQTYETAIAYSESGEVIFKVDGTEDEVVFNQEQLNMMRGAVLTHNHPRGSSFSPEDIYLMMISKSKEIRVVTDRGVNFSISKITEVTTLEIESFWDTYNEIEETLKNKLSPLVTQNIVSVESANKYHNHIINEFFATEYGYEYIVENMSPSEDYEINRIKLLTGYE